MTDTTLSRKQQEKQELIRKSEWESKHPMEKCTGFEGTVQTNMNQKSIFILLHILPGYSHHCFVLSLGFKYVRNIFQVLVQLIHNGNIPEHKKA